MYVSAKLTFIAVYFVLRSLFKLTFTQSEDEVVRTKRTKFLYASLMFF